MLKRTDHSKLPDAELMAKVAQRDKRAFDALYARHHRSLFRYLYRLCWQDQGLAEDLLQETFLRVFKSAERFDPDRSFVTWLLSIGYNLVKNEYRRQAGRGEAVSLEETHAWENAPVERSHDLEAWQQALHAALAQLPESHASVFWLRHEHRMEVGVIAEILEVPVGTVKSRLYYVHRRLAKELAAYQDLLKTL